MYCDCLLKQINRSISIGLRDRKSYAIEHEKQGYSKQKSKSRLKYCVRSTYADVVSNNGLTLV